MNTLRERLKSKRLALGLTQSELAERVSLKQQAIQLIEAGKTLQPRCILGLARALKCDPSWLLYGDENDPRKGA